MNMAEFESFLGYFKDLSIAKTKTVSNSNEASPPVLTIYSYPESPDSQDLSSINIARFPNLTQSPIRSLESATGTPPGSPVPSNCSYIPDSPFELSDAKPSLSAIICAEGLASNQGSSFVFCSHCGHYHADSHCSDYACQENCSPTGDISQKYSRQYDSQGSFSDYGSQDNYKPSRDVSQKCKPLFSLHGSLSGYGSEENSRSPGGIRGQYPSCNSSSDSSRSPDPPCVNVKGNCFSCSDCWDR